MRGAPALPLLALALCACPPTPLEGGRYTCDPEGDRSVNSAQCPGDWRCGLEGYCHRNEDVGTPWRCETDADCESQFHCGLASSRDHHECHDPRAPRADACEVDGDCVGGWRCAAYGTCADPTHDALYGGDAIEGSGETKLSPLDERAFELVSMSPLIATSLNTQLQLAVSKRAGVLEALVTAPDVPSFSTYRLDEPLATLLVAQGPLSLTLRGGIAIDRDDRPRFYATLSDGRLKAYTLEGDGGVTAQDQVVLDGYTHQPLPLPYVPTQFKQGTAAVASTVPGVLAFDHDPHRPFLRILGPDWAFVGGYTTETGPDLDQVFDNQIHDLAMLTSLADERCFFTTDNQGLWVRQAGFSAFEPLLTPWLGNQACPGSPAPRARRLQTLGGRWLALETLTDAGAAELSLLDLLPALERTDVANATRCASFTGNSCDPNDVVPSRTDLGPCPACPGAALLDFAVVAEGGGAELEVHCGSPDGGVGTYQRLAHRAANSTACDRRLIQGASSLFSSSDVRAAGPPVPGQVAWTGAHGELWSGASAATASSITFDRAPDGLVLRGQGPRDLIAFTPEVVGLPTPGYGLTSAQALNLVSGVTHEPRWVMQGAVALDLSGAADVAAGKVIALVAAPPGAAPYHAVRTRAATDARVLVVSAGSQLFAAELEGALAGLQPFATAPLRVSMLDPIRSLAFPEGRPASGGAWLSGYALTAGGPQRVVADTSQRWRSEAVPLPAALTPLEVWFERDRGRLGCTDGSVYALPSRVQVAGPLGEGVLDFEQACGQQLALSSDGLYRLDARPGDARGAWVRLPLPAGFTGEGLGSGRVHALGADVYVFTAAGATARVTLSTCP